MCVLVCVYNRRDRHLLLCVLLYCASAFNVARFAALAKLVPLFFLYTLSAFFLTLLLFTFFTYYYLFFYSYSSSVIIVFIQDTFFILTSWAVYRETLLSLGMAITTFIQPFWR